MAGANYMLDKGYTVSSSATNVKFGYAAVLSSNTVVTTAGANALAIGVYQETLDTAKVSTGKATVDVRIQGITKAIGGATPITIMSRVKTDANGKFIPCTVALENAVGVALSATSADNDMFDLLLTPGNQVAAS